MLIRIPATDTFSLFLLKNCNVCFKKPKINEKEVKDKNRPLLMFLYLKSLHRRLFGIQTWIVRVVLLLNSRTTRLHNLTKALSGFHKLMKSFQIVLIICPYTNCNQRKISTFLVSNLITFSSFCSASKQIMTLE